MIQIFDMVNERPVLSVHCHMIKEFRDVIDFYPEDHLQVIYYIQAVTCLDPSQNVYMNQEEDMREEIVLADLAPIKFSLECPIMLAAKEKCRKLFETPVDRSFLGAKHMIDKISRMLYTEEITTTGKDANITALRGVVKDLPDLWKSYKTLTADMLKEQSVARGKIRRAYDQTPGYKNSQESDNDETPIL